jgi:hypothetical protein
VSQRIARSASDGYVTRKDHFAMHRFLGLGVIAALVVASAVLFGGAQRREPVAASPHKHVCINDVLEDGDDGMTFGRGKPLSWYKLNFAPPESVETPVFVCFAPGTPPDVVEYVSKIEQQGLDDPMARYNLTSRWSGSQGTPRALTWSFAPDGLSIPGGVGEPTSPNTLFATLDARFASLGGRAYWINRVQQCFDRWSELSGLSYTRITVGGNDWDDGAGWGTAGAPGLRGDIRIAMHNIDGVNGVLAYNQFPSNGDMVLDESEGWASGASSTNQHRFFRNTIMHEHGHGMGLLHVCPAPPTFGGGSGMKLMEPYLNTAFDGPQHDDIRAAQRHYGDDYESNDSAATATYIGVVEVGSPIHFGDVPPPLTGTAAANSANLSIDADGKVDFWRFTVNGNRTATVTITPRGWSYASYTQTSACNNVTVNVDSLSIANLDVQILGTNGVTVLGTSAVAPLGSAETLSNVVLPAAGDYYIRVFEGDAPAQSQLYFIDLSVTAPCAPPTLSPIPDTGAVCDTLFTYAPSASGGFPPLTWSLGGTPPAGMIINSSTGQISWPNPVVSVTPYSVTVQVDSAGGCGGASDTFQITVIQADLNGDGVVNALDVPFFVNQLTGISPPNLCAADLDNDGDVDGDDVQWFVNLL